MTAPPQDRPTAWATPSDRPAPGDRCRLCGGSRWWADKLGWRCGVCRPVRVPGVVEEVGTDE